MVDWTSYKSINQPILMAIISNLNKDSGMERKNGQSLIFLDTFLRQSTLNVRMV